MIQLLIFDFDGTILDTETPWFQAYSKVYEDYGFGLTLEEYSQCIGTSSEVYDPFQNLLNLLNRKVDPSVVRSQILQYQKQFISGQGVRPGVLSCLQQAKEMGLHTAIASSSHRQWIEHYLNEFQLADYFDIIMSKDVVTKVKPDPELYLKVLDHFGVPGHNALAFEDSLNGLKAAKQAGIHCVVVPNEVTRFMDFGDHEPILQSLEGYSLNELMDMVKSNKIA